MNDTIVKTVACGLARPPARSDQGGLDFLAPPFASRQKVEEEKPNLVIQIIAGEVLELQGNK